MWGGSSVEFPRILVIHHTAIEGAEQYVLVNESHKKEGYKDSLTGENICYHFFVGTDGTIRQPRSLSERAGCTRNSYANASAIQIVVAGNFQKQKPSREQLAALRKLIGTLDEMYHFSEIKGHKDESPTACPGKYLEEAISDLMRGEKKEVWNITRYYTPVEGQLKYYRDTYEQDYKVNCSGDCLVTSSGYRLKKEDAMKIAACPPEIPFGQKIEIDGIGLVRCEDRGGAIKQKRLDVWTGIGTDGLRNIYDPANRAGYLTVKFVK